MTLPGKKLLWTLVLVLATVSGWAQKTGILRGTVTDAETGEPQFKFCLVDDDFLVKV